MQKVSNPYLDAFRIAIVLLIAVFIALEIGLVYFYYYLEQHYWLIPAFLFFNILVTWLALKYLVLKSFLFSYGQKFIVNNELKSLNE